MVDLYPSDLQLHLFHEGTLYKSHHLFGAHVIKEENGTYTKFCVWAPEATRVRVAGNFNGWNATGYDLEKVNEQGIWVISIKEDLTHCLYKFEITTQAGEVLLKADPYAFYSELRPETASVVYPLSNYTWNDQNWIKRKKKMNAVAEPLAIYEVHIGSWKKKDDGEFLTYSEIASELIPYAKANGYTHIEIMPLTEHPLDASWGYQATGYFSITSRYGSPEEFMYLVDVCHQNGIGVILDWTPGHFCKDAHGLYRFDGSYAYEYASSMDRENVVWGTANFNLGRPEVQSFLISSALFWLEHYHIDGFRVDAVANIIYWPNADNQENVHGINFLKKLNSAVAQFDPQALMIAEDSTDWPNVTGSVDEGGLGFSFKWNMGWMNDILSYMETLPSERSLRHNHVTFSILYAFTEKFILPFSHDEVVHGKKSLLNKMPGEYWDKFAQLRLLLGFMYTHPGKKLNFMGNELGQFSEWKDKEQLDWNLFEYDMHVKLNLFVMELNKIYKRSKPLYELDDRSEGFEWIDVNNHSQSIFSFIRKGINPDELLVIICNFTEKSYTNYRIGVPVSASYREILSSDALDFGGAGNTNKKVSKVESVPYHGKPYSLTMNIPSFGISILRPVKQRKGSEQNEETTLRSHAVGRGERKQA